MLWAWWVLGNARRLANALVKRFRDAYFGVMFQFCIPTKATTVPDGPDWLYEIKYDGYRLRVERNSERVRLITRAGRLPLFRAAQIGDEP
jgi:ATP-dependent DNA ligase